MLRDGWEDSDESLYVAHSRSIDYDRLYKDPFFKMFTLPTLHLQKTSDDFVLALQEEGKYPLCLLIFESGNLIEPYRSKNGNSWIYEIEFGATTFKDAYTGILIKVRSLSPYIGLWNWTVVLTFEGGVLPDELAGFQPWTDVVKDESFLVLVRFSDRFNLGDDTFPQPAQLYTFGTQRSALWRLSYLSTKGGEWAATIYWSAYSVQMVNIRESLILLGGS